MRISISVEYDGNKPPEWVQRILRSFNHTVVLPTMNIRPEYVQHGPALMRGDRIIDKITFTGIVLPATVSDIEADCAMREL